MKSIDQSSGISYHISSVRKCLEKSQRRFVRRLSKFTLKCFVFDIVAVMLSIRTACLIDSFSFDDPEGSLRSILEDLRKELPSFLNVDVIIEPNFQQVFFFNIELLAKRFELMSWRNQDNGKVKDFQSPNCRSLLENQISESANFVAATFIVLDEELTRLSSMPLKVQSIIIDCLDKSKSDLVISLTPGLTPDILVPFAGFLLEYPIIYIPSYPQQENFLSGIALNVVECFLNHEAKPSPGFETEKHSLFKFSYPSQLASQDQTMTVERVQERIISVFKERVHRADMQWDVDVITHTATFDRVGL